MLVSSPKSQKKKIIITLIAISVVSAVIFLYKTSPPVLFAQGILQSIFSAPKSYFYSLGKSARDDRENTLNKKIRSLEQQIVKYQIMERDNEALKSQFTVSGETTQSMVAAKIIGVQGENQKPHTFTVNAGRAEGISKNMTVIFEKYLVGKIEDVSEHFSVVITPYNPKFQVLAKLPETNANGIVIGRSDLILFDGVLITDQLKKGGVVVTKGEVDRDGIGVIPDMILGKISSISKRETAPFQSAQLEPPINYQKLTNIFIISKM